MLANLGMIMMNFGTVDKDWKFITTIFTNIQSAVGVFMSAMVILAVIICLAGMIFSKNQKTVESFQMWLKRIAICYIAYLCVGSIVSGVENFTKDPPA